ncbi:MAG: hypothetical protein J6R11_06900, partial [Bacteroidaceae bacterium]|nr:hypothetical protein [Bacteroidaceae bacterium]
VLAFGKIDQITLVNQIHAKAESIITYDGGTFDVSLLPNFELFGVDLAATPSFTNISILVLIPFLAAGVSWLSMVLVRKWNGNGMAAA